MPSEQELQELLRLLSKQKLTIMAAMSRARVLSDAGLGSINDIASSSLEGVEAALGDVKAAKSLQTACRKWIRGQQKRPANEGADDEGVVKRPRAAGGGLQGPSHLSHLRTDMMEKSLRLPVDTTESVILSTSVFTNRAPLLMAFVFQLLRYTMPEQPVSSRLSLAQGVVSLTSRSTAANLGLGKEPIAVEQSWTSGQPRVRIMGRTVPVLKRSGYSWKGDEKIVGDKIASAGESTGAKTAAGTHVDGAREEGNGSRWDWTCGPDISLKGSTFTVHVGSMTIAGEREKAVAELLKMKPQLKGATHNAWAVRVQEVVGKDGTGSVREFHFDDGETGCGKLLLQVLRESGAINTVAVLSRWFGGILLGPDRWRLMRVALQGALAERCRRGGEHVDLGGDAVWALDPEGLARVETSTKASPAAAAFTVVGANIFDPQAARSYLLRSFSSTEAGGRRASKDDGDDEGHGTLGPVLGALELLFESWADHVSMAELDEKAWAWYLAVRPRVQAGPEGWGNKTTVRLAAILDLGRKDGGCAAGPVGATNSI